MIVLPSRTKKNIELKEDSDVWVYGTAKASEAQNGKRRKPAPEDIACGELLIKGHLDQNKVRPFENYIT